MSLNTDVLTGVLTTQYPDVHRTHIENLVKQHSKLGYDKALSAIEAILLQEKAEEPTLEFPKRLPWDFTCRWK